MSTSTDAGPARSVMFMLGQVQAILGVLQLLIRHDPQRFEMLRELEVMAQHTLAQLEYLPASADVVIEGYQHVLETLRKAATAGLEK